MMRSIWRCAYRLVLRFLGTGRLFADFFDAFFGLFENILAVLDQFHSLFNLGRHYVIQLPAVFAVYNHTVVIGNNYSADRHGYVCFNIEFVMKNCNITGLKNIARLRRAVNQCNRGAHCLAVVDLRFFRQIDERLQRRSL